MVDLVIELPLGSAEPTGRGHRLRDAAGQREGDERTRHQQQ
jgi:hypothetical protein